MKCYFCCNFSRRIFMKNRFGQRLSAYRDYVGETQEQLANAINVKLRTLQTWEQGIHNCSFDDLL